MPSPKPLKKIKFSIDDPCPCGSGQKIADCHFDPVDSQFRKKVPSLRPSGPPTGHANPRCYLSVTRDCSEKISREHYISRSVLEKLGQIVGLTGAHWQEEGQTLETSLGNLTAKILCKRHNESLSPLDTEAGIFFGALADALSDISRKTLSRKPIVHLASGEALELWMLKVACGHYFGFGSRNGVRLNQSYAIDLVKIERAFFGRNWDPRCGLYVYAAEGSIFTAANHISVSALLDEHRKQMTGVKTRLLGLDLDLLFEAENTNPGPWTDLAKRPTELVWRRGHRQHSIILTWPIGHPILSIRMDHIWNGSARR